MSLFWLMLACSRTPQRFPDPSEDLLRRLDADGSGALSEDELRGHAARRVLSFADQDRDGLLEQGELRRLMSHVGTLPASGRGKGKGKAKGRGKAKRDARSAPPPGGDPAPGSGLIPCLLYTSDAADE